MYSHSAEKSILLSVFLSSVVIFLEYVIRDVSKKNDEYFPFEAALCSFFAFKMV